MSHPREVPWQMPGTFRVSWVTRGRPSVQEVDSSRGPSDTSQPCRRAVNSPGPGKQLRDDPLPLGPEEVVGKDRVSNH